jgi:N-acetylglucosamine transport system permease protein
VIVIYPMLWSVIAALKTDAEIFSSPWALPAAPVFENFVRAWTKAQIGAYIGNTFLVIIPGIFFTLLLSSMAAYVFARYEFGGKRLLVTMFLIGMMFPIFLALVPLYLVMKSIKDITGIQMLNTFHGLIIVYVAYSLSWTIFFMTAFFKTLPKEIAEAGRPRLTGPATRRSSSRSCCRWPRPGWCRRPSSTSSASGTSSFCRRC